MSIHRNRSKLSKITNSREYRIEIILGDTDPYDDFIYYSWTHGMYPNQRRSYRTWKHNRYKQWK